MNILNRLSADFLQACLIVSIALGASQLGFSQIMVWKENQRGFAKPAPPDKPNQTLSIIPAAEPEPNLKIRFWESPVLRHAGSANELLIRARHEYLKLPNQAELQQQYTSAAEPWHHAALPELVGSDLEQYLAAHSIVLKLVHAAARRSTIDLVQPVELAGELLDLEDLGRVQNYRDFARLLTLQSRWELAHGRIDSAIERIGTGFRLAGIVTAENPNMISKLVEVAICGLMFEALKELVQHPECPNLYWALASLPDSYWNSSHAIDGEFAYQDHRLAPLMKPLGADESQLEVAKRLVETIRVVPALLDQQDSMDRTQAELLAGAAILLFADQGRVELARYGYTDQAISQMSPAAAVLLSTQLGFASGRDAVFKWAMIDSSAERLEQSMAFRNPRGFLTPSKLLLGAMLPAVQASRSANLRILTIQRRSMLIEALRAYAAVHHELPATLDNLQPLPAPLNPQTKQNFVYGRTSATAAKISNLPMYPGDNQTETLVVLETRPVQQP